jgi:hypothetical protein
MKSVIRVQLFLFLAIAAISGQVRTALNDAPNNCYYTIEFQKPADGAADLRIHFSSLVSPDKVQSILSQELRQAAAFSGRRTDIMGVALLNEARLPLPDGTAFMVYNASSDRIESGKPYVSSRPMPSSSGAIGVSLDIAMQVDTKGQLRMVGKTNLPSGMAGVLELKSPALSFYDCDSVVVSHGEFVSKWFSAHYRPLPRGAYTFCFLTPPPGAQPQKVQAVIGKNGENLSGPYVIDRLADNIVKYENTFELK